VSDNGLGSVPPDDDGAAPHPTRATATATVRNRAVRIPEAFHSLIRMTSSSRTVGLVFTVQRALAS